MQLPLMIEFRLKHINILEHLYTVVAEQVSAQNILGESSSSLDFPRSYIVVVFIANHKQYQYRKVCVLYAMR